MDIGFIGLGTMGSGMVRNLLLAGHRVRVHNRDMTKAEPLVEAGAGAASSIADVMAGAEVVMYCLADDAAIEAVVLAPGGVADHATAGQLVIDLSTITPDVGLRERAAIEAKGADFLDAPVFGTRGETNAGGLWVVVGGTDEAFERALPVLEPISETIHHMGPGGSGHRMKLVGNMLVASQIRAIGDALATAVRLGLDPETVLDVAAVTDFRTPIYAGVGARAIAGDHAPDFALALLLKDLGLVAAQAEATGVPVAGLAETTDLVREGVAKGYGAENASALVKVIAERAGVQLG